MKKTRKILSFMLFVLMLVSSITMTANSVASNDYTQWKQGDAEWNQAEAWPSSQYPSATSRMMKDAGCVVTSLAILLRHHNVITSSDVHTFNPWICNEELKKVSAFNKSADLIWADVNKAYPGFELVDYRTTYSFSTIERLYREGYACIINVGGHYVALKNVEGATVNIMDPGYSNRPTLASYSNPLTIIYYKVTSTNTDPTTSERVEFNGHYYQVFDEGLDWFAAKTRCEEMGGHLVTITSAEEQDFVSNLIKCGNRINYWLGGTDEDTEGVWKWVSGEPFEYDNWHTGEPSNSEYINDEFENYLILWADLNCVWNDAYYDVGNRLSASGHTKVKDIGFICEWETNPDKPTEPSTPDEPTPEPSTPDEPDKPKNEGNIFTKIIEAIKNLFNKIFSIFKW